MDIIGALNLEFLVGKGQFLQSVKTVMMHNSDSKIK